MKENLFKLLLLFISFLSMSCKDNSSESSLLNNPKYEIILSGWNGKMGREDRIIKLNINESFSQSVISWKDSCGKISSSDYNKLILELDSIKPMEINLYHKSSCTDAQGGMQTTKLTLTDKRTNATNTIRWSDCENDEANKSLIEKLNLVRDHINDVIKKAEKQLCN